MLKKYSKEELYKMDAIEVYKLVLEGKHIKRFPIGFWEQSEAIDNAIKCTKFLFLNILKLEEEDILDIISIKLLQKYKLSGMLKACFNTAPYELINTMYPGKFHPWELKNSPNGIWTKENMIKATKWLIEEKLQLTDEQLKEQLSIKLFEENGLLGMLQVMGNSSPYEAINLAYPGKFHPWEFKIAPKHYWNKETGIEATKWLIEEKLKFTNDELREQLSQNLFNSNGLVGMLDVCFNDSPYEAINSAYPDKFKSWEFKYVSRNYWTIERGIEATKWLIEEKLQLKSDEDFKNKISKTIFMDNGLAGMYQICFNGDLYTALNNVYPNRFKPWQFKQVPKGYWESEDNCIKAIKWLVEEKLRVNSIEELSYNLFKENGLCWMLEVGFNGDYNKAIMTAYPKVFNFK